MTLVREGGGAIEYGEGSKEGEGQIGSSRIRTVVCRMAFCKCHAAAGPVGSVRGVSKRFVEEHSEMGGFQPPQFFTEQVSQSTETTEEKAEGESHSAHT